VGGAEFTLFAQQRKLVAPGEEETQPAKGKKVAAK
jgi:hypothetical protein